MAAVWAAGPEPMMATFVWGVVEPILEVEEKLGEWEEKGREGAVVVKGFL